MIRHPYKSTVSIKAWTTRKQNPEPRPLGMRIPYRRRISIPVPGDELDRVLDTIPFDDMLLEHSVHYDIGGWGGPEGSFMECTIHECSPKTARKTWKAMKRAVRVYRKNTCSTITFEASLIGSQKPFRKKLTVPWSSAQAEHTLGWVAPEDIAYDYGLPMGTNITRWKNGCDIELSMKGISLKTAKEIWRLIRTPYMACCE